MKKYSGNYMKVSLYKAKVCPDISLSSYSLKLDFCKQSLETDKISGTEIELGGKSYFFELPPGVKPTNLEISAVCKTYFIFDSNIAKVSIPVNFNKLDDKKEWYYLKNSKDENVISILTSIYCEIKTEKNFTIDNSININNNNSYIIPPHGLSNKNDLSYDMYRNNSNHNFLNIMNKTLANPNLNYSNMNNILNVNSGEGTLTQKKPNNMDNTILYNENYKSPDMSCITNNLFSPYSYRVEKFEFDKSNINLNTLNMSNLNSKLNNMITVNKNNLTYDNINCNLSCNIPLLNTSDSFLDSKMTDENYIAEHPEIISKIRNKVVQIREEQEKLKKVWEDLNKNKEKIKQKDAILLKEKQKLEQYIRNFKLQKSDLENKNNILNQNYSKFNSENLKFQNEKEIFAYEKDLFFNLNFVLYNGKIINNFNLTEEKINEVNNKLSINNQSLPTGITYNSSGSASLNNNLISHINSTGSQSNIKVNANSKKEVVIEKTQNILLYTTRSKERELSKDKSNRGSCDLNNKSTSDKNIIQLCSPTSNKATAQIKMDNYNTISNNDSTSIIQKTLNISGNTSIINSISKFYTPIAQIDLNKKNENRGSPTPNEPKIEKSENKLIDSLDNLNFLYNKSSAIKPDDRKTPKMQRAGSDEQKSNNKKIDDKKKVNNKLGSGSSNASSNTTNNTSNIIQLSSSNTNYRDKRILSNLKNSASSSDKSVNAAKKELLNSSIGPSNVNLSTNFTSNLSNYNSNKSPNSNTKINTIKKTKI